MLFDAKTYCTLITAASDKAVDALKACLPITDFAPLVTAGSVGAAKRAVLERSFDLVLINAPLGDEFGTEFALSLCDGGEAGVLLVVPAEQYEEIAARVARYGVLTLPRPTTRQAVTQALQLLCATRERLRRMERKYETLEDRMEEIRLVNRAKWMLIDRLRMSEPEAHRYLEKQAMDLRITRRAAAEQVLNTYGRPDQPPVDRV